MFQSVRPNSTIYVFHKGESPRLEIGYVVNAPIIKPKYQVPPTFGQQEMVVDLVVKVNGQNVNYTGLPAQLDVSDSYSNGEQIVIADNKEAMNAELLSIKQKSIDIINSVDMHKKMLSNCDQILADLNPEFKEKQQQQQEISDLRNQVNEMARNISELMAANKSLIETLKKEN